MRKFKFLCGIVGVTILAFRMYGRGGMHVVVCVCGGVGGGSLRWCTLGHIACGWEVHPTFLQTNKQTPFIQVMSSRPNGESVLKCSGLLNIGVLQRQGGVNYKVVFNTVQIHTNIIWVQTNTIWILTNTTWIHTNTIWTHANTTLYCGKYWRVAERRRMLESITR